MTTTSFRSQSLNNSVCVTGQLMLNTAKRLEFGDTVGQHQDLENLQMYVRPVFPKLFSGDPLFKNDEPSRPNSQQEIVII